MTDVTELEQELIDASAFRMKRFAKRQDYLAALARAVEQMELDDFDTLSNEAVDWYNAACNAVNANDDIIDFEPDEEVEEADTDDDAADSEEADGDDDEAAEGPEAEAEADEDDEPEAPEEVEPPVAPKAKRGKTNAAADEVPEAKPEGKKPAKEPVVTDPALIKKFREREKAKKGKKKDNLPPTRYDDISGVKNRYGYYEGTKVDEACKMFEKGASMKEVRDYLGDNYYNMLRAVRDEGHSVEKNDAGQFVLKHKDDLPKKGDK
jgi:hypothetical protein